MAEFWFNIRTRQVEEGHQSDSRDLMGPYDSRAAAERALETARANTDQWDDEDKQWREGPTD